MKTHTAMQMSRFFRVAAFLVLGLDATIACADQSQFINAKLETRVASEPLSTAISQIAVEAQQTLWIAYEVPAISAEQSLCCGNCHDNSQEGACGTCNLEKEYGDSFIAQNQNKTIKLEAAPQFTILLRVDHKHVMRIRMASSNCTLDVGGLRVVWLTGVKPEDSVAFLAHFVTAKELEAGREDGVSSQALMVIAQHADASADRALASFVSPDQPASLREKASFWLGAARGKSGLTLLEKMAKTDPSPDMRAKVSFALFVSHEPKDVDDIIRMAKEDSDAHVRGQALFWLAQNAGQKASTAITGAIQNDPDTEAKKKAVFALTQMPKGEGVPKLIEVAQNNRNPEVRKQAMFWLGQSQDPRALAFFEEILSQ